MTNPNLAPQQNPNQLGLSQQANIAFHGIAARVAEFRMQRAGSVMETLDHKKALAADVGRMAMTGMARISLETVESRASTGEQPIKPREFLASDTATGEPAMPRNAFERFRAKRADKKGYKKSVADVYARRTQMIYGNEEGRLNKQEKRQQKRAISREARQGGLLPSEARVEKTKIDATKMKLGEQSRKLTGKQQRKTGNSLQRSANQPISTKWRDMRRKRAIGRIQENHYRAERHRQAIEEIRNNS